MTLTLSLRGDDGYEVTVEGEINPQCLLSSDAMIHQVFVPAASHLQRCFLERIIDAEVADLQRGQQFAILSRT